MIIEIDGKKPRIAPDAFVAPTAVLIGDVIVESRASVWWGAIARADWNTISIGARSSIQDNCVIHCTLEKGVKVGKDVTVGHAAVLHSCEVGDGSLVGMHATVLDDAVISEGAVVSAGSVVTPRTRVESGILVGGVPARPIRELSEEEKGGFEAGKKMYEELAQKYLSLGL